MKTTFLTSLLAALLLALTFSTAAQAMSPEEAEAQCREYAKDDGVTADEMADYMKDCIDNLMASSEESGSSGSDN